ncbi:Hypothetical predicted protein, partial [Pelobates cultripes]
TTLPHFTNTALPQWVLMEKQAIKPFDVPTIMWLPKKFRPETPQMPSQLKIAVRAWDKLRHKLVTPLSPATPLNTITYCIPTFNAKPWIAKGVTHLHQILAHNKLKTFPTLQKEFHIPEASQFSHIQLSSFIRKHTEKSSAPDDNPLGMTKWEQTTTRGSWAPTFKPLSWCYQLIRPTQHFADSNPAKHWAQDLQCHISKDQWERAIVTTKKLIKSE